MKKYDSYKDSGIEWIGKIPENWEVTKIKYLVIGEDTLLIDGDWIESKDIVFDSDNIKYITTGNIGAGYYKEQGNGFITEETFEKLNCTEVFEGDLLISRLNAPIGRACLIPNLNKRVVTSVDNVILRPNKDHNKRFLVHLMSNDRYFEHTSLIARGATMQRISRSLLADIKICTPPIKEQSYIASFLDDKTFQINTLIQKKQQMIALLEEEKIAVINEAVTKGLNPNAPMKDSGIEWLGDVPAHWEVKKLKYVAKVNGQSLPETTDGEYELSYIDIGNVFFGGHNEPTLYKFKDAPSRARRIVNAGDILVSTVRTYLKAITQVHLDINNLIASTGFAVITSGNELMDEYLFRVISSQKFVDTISAISTGVSYPAINSSDLGNIHVWYPTSMVEQEGIINHLKSEFSHKNSMQDKLQKEILLLQEYRTALISEAVTGKIDVRDYQPEFINSPALA